MLFVSFKYFLERDEDEKDNIDNKNRLSRLSTGNDNHELCL